MRSKAAFTTRRPLLSGQNLPAEVSLQCYKARSTRAVSHCVPRYAVSKQSWHEILFMEFLNVMIQRC